MSFVITSPCIDEKAADCVDVCPVDCIEEGEINTLLIQTCASTAEPVKWRVLYPLFTTKTMFLIMRRNSSRKTVNFLKSNTKKLSHLIYSNRGIAFFQIICISQTVYYPTLLI